MWIFKDNKWVRNSESLSKEVYDNQKQDISKTRLYSKCLSGSLYTSLINNDYIYDVNLYKDDSTWYIDFFDSSYINNIQPILNPSQIKFEIFNRYLSEYGFTTKSHFSPSDLINDKLSNYKYVDLCTYNRNIILSDFILDLNKKYNEIYIDGIKLINGHRILIENQITYVNLSNTIDPEQYFNTNYYIVEEDILNTKYYYFNNLNGVYDFNDGYFNRVDDEILDYNNIDSISYYVKLGSNKDKQFKIFRNKDGYYPIFNNNDGIEYYEFENNIIRTKLDYNNAFDINYNSNIVEGSQMLEGVYIPERVISVGEFGFINVTQNGKSNIIKNKFKFNLNSITSNSKYYFACGDNGVVLRIDKIKLSVSIIEVSIKTTLNSILFFDDLNGFIVGDFNTILYTNDGGFNWNVIYYDNLNGNNYNKIVYYKIDIVYIIGSNGIFIECVNSLDKWILTKKSIYRKENQYDIIDLIYDINDAIIFKLTNNDWNIISDNVDVMNQYDFIILTTNNSNLIFYPINFKLNYDFYYLDFDVNIGDINNIEVIDQYKIFINSTKSGILYIDILNFDLILNDTNIIVNELNNDLLDNGEFNESNDIDIINIINDGYFNNIVYFNDNIYVVGNNSINSYINYNGYSSTYSYIYEDLDNTIYNDIFPKFLILDYDIASKLNFFDDFGNYILPNTLDIEVLENNLNNGYYIDINGDDNYTSWLDYYKDSLSTYKYYTTISDINKVLFNTKFSKVDSGFLNIVNPNINIDKSYILPSAPTIVNNNRNRYVMNIGDINIQPTIDNNYNVLIYDYLMILKVPLNSIDEIGDCIYLESNIISTYFIINNIYILGGYKYLYVYTDFNNNIINNLLNYDDFKIFNINKFTDIDDLYYKFNLHPISFGYNMNFIDNELLINNFYNIKITPLFNNYTSYYNMSLSVDDNYGNYISNYDSSYIKFGYNPMYNLKDYLNNIDSVVFNDDKVFTSIPSYLNIPCNSLSTLNQDSIYIDTGKVTNKIHFGSNLKYEYDTIFVNIFYDIILFSNLGAFSNEKSLVINKYYDDTTDTYVIELLNKINYGPLSSNISSISISGRNTLLQISEDLNYINNISRSKSFKNVDNQYLISGYFNNKYKFNTDSYAKVLLSDGDIKNKINLLLYTDYNNKLSLNFINFDRVIRNRLLNMSSYDISLDSNADLRIRLNLSEKHEFKNGDLVYIEVDSDDDRIVNGCHVVYDIIDSYSIILYTEYNTSYQNISGDLYFDKFDVFSSIQPVDIFEFSNESLPRRAKKVDFNNFDFNNFNISLYNTKSLNYRYELVDGLDIISINEKYSWIFEADIDNAIIGEDTNGLVWYSGDWSCGRWFEGTWYSGTWYSGDWYSGTWNSNKIKYNLYNVDVSSQYDYNMSKWYNGRFFEGTWNGGTWYNGRTYNIIWNKGYWYNGIWNDGIWNDGYFMGGIWVYGTWNNGYLNQNSKPTYWINGTWNNGYFENGRWLNGVFDKRISDKDSIFGYSSTLSKKSIWDSGIFKNGKFMSDIDNRNSIWKTGRWLNGTFDSGLSFNIDFKKGIWNNGISDDIEIIEIDLNGDNNKILLNGVFRFNSEDEITIINDYDDPDVYQSSVDTIYDFRRIGSLESPGIYKIIKYEIIDDKYTLLYILGRLESGDSSLDINNTNNNNNLHINNIYSDFRYKEWIDITNTNKNKKIDIKVVSNFKNCEWYNGCWYNGVFEDGNFYGGIWYNGTFDGNWG